MPPMGTCMWELEFWIIFKLWEQWAYCQWWKLKALFVRIHKVVALSAGELLCSAMLPAWCYCWLLLPHALSKAVFQTGLWDFSEENTEKVKMLIIQSLTPDEESKNSILLFHKVFSKVSYLFLLESSDLMHSWHKLMFLEVSTLLLKTHWCHDLTA